MSARVRRVDQDMAATAARLLHPPISDQLRTRYRQLPVMVRTAGLAATYAFCASKAADGEGALATAYREVTKGMRECLRRRGLLTEPQAASDHAVLTALGGMGLHDYTRASAEIAELTGWLSRLAEAVHDTTSTTTNTTAAGGAGEAGD